MVSVPGIAFALSLLLIQGQWRLLRRGSTWEDG